MGGGEEEHGELELTVGTLLRSGFNAETAPAHLRTNLTPARYPAKRPLRLPVSPQLGRSNPRPPQKKHQTVRTSDEGGGRRDPSDIMWDLRTHGSHRAKFSDGKPHGTKRLCFMCSLRPKDFGRFVVVQIPTQNCTKGPDEDAGGRARRCRRPSATPLSVGQMRVARYRGDEREGGGTSHAHYCRKKEG